MKKISTARLTSVSGGIIAGFVLVIMLISVNGVNSAISGSSDDPRTMPIPELDFDDPAKSIVVTVFFDGREQATFESAFVSFERAHTHAGDPPLLRGMLYDHNDILIEQFDSWHPLWSEIYGPDGSTSVIIEETSSGQFIFPFNANIKTLNLVDVPMDMEVVSVDLTETIVSFCVANPQEQDCLIPISIDIKPGSDENKINAKSKGVIPVVIFGSTSFDVSLIDVLTLRLENASPSHDLSDPDVYDSHLEYVNGDGFIDLVSHYSQKQTGLLKEDTQACISGFTVDGTPIDGCDSVIVK